MDASRKMPDDYMDSIEPFDYSAMVPFSTAYLPGFLRTSRTSPWKSAAPERKSGPRTPPWRAMQRQVSGYETCIPVGKDAQLRRGTVRCALLPVWLLSTQWEGKFPLCHERPDRQNGQRPAGIQKAVLGMVGRPDRRDHGGADGHHRVCQLAVRRRRYETTHLRSACSAGTFVLHGRFCAGRGAALDPPAITGSTTRRGWFPKRIPPGWRKRWMQPAGITAAASTSCSLPDFTEYGYSDIYEFAQDVYEDSNLGVETAATASCWLSARKPVTSALPSMELKRTPPLPTMAGKKFSTTLFERFQQRKLGSGACQFCGYLRVSASEAQSGTPVGRYPAAAIRNPFNLPSAGRRSRHAGFLPAAIIAFVICGVMKKEDETAQKASGAAAYVTAADPKVRTDHYTHSTVPQNAPQNR